MRWLNTRVKKYWPLVAYFCPQKSVNFIFFMYSGAFARRRGTSPDFFSMTSRSDSYQSGAAPLQVTIRKISPDKIDRINFPIAIFVINNIL